MAISIKWTGYGAIVAVGVVLFAAESPAETQAPAAQAAPAAPSSAVAGNGITLHSVKVDLPASGRTFPGGAGAETVTDNCTECHSPSMVLYQPSLTRAQWEAEVNHMIKDFKAPVNASDVPAIVDYLAALNGSKDGGPGAPAHAPTRTGE